MSQNESEPDVACTLTGDQRADRAGDVRVRLVAHYDGFEPVEDGVEVRFDGADETLRAVASFASNELVCCSFAEYEIAVSPPYDQTVLTVTGPEGTREMFREGLVEELETASP